MNPAMTAAKVRIQQAQAQYDQITKIAQAACFHPTVAEVPWSRCYDNSPPARICPSCGFEEQGSHWSGGNIWSKHDYSEPQLGNQDGRWVKIVNSEEFYSYRP